MKPTIPELVEKLAAEGSSRQIADFLVDQGVSGAHAGHAGKCAVAQWLQRESDACHVGVSRASAVDCTHAADRGDRKTILPEVVTQFIHDFDHHRYPELEK